jgi:hypothetical protein
VCVCVCVVCVLCVCCVCVVCVCGTSCIGVSSIGVYSLFVFFSIVFSVCSLCVFFFVCVQPLHLQLHRSSATDIGSDREKSRSAISRGGPGLKLCTSAVAVPHADKVRDGARGVNKRSFGHAGDDAYFVGGEKAIGVADGVGQVRGA